MLMATKMNWDNELSSIMSATDGSVAKIRERLIRHGRVSKSNEGVHPPSERSHAGGLDLATPPTLSLVPPALGAVQWADLAVIQAQLHSQRQAIDWLTQTLRSVERERCAQQRQIQTLQEEVRMLWERLEVQERDLERGPGAVRWPGQVKREVGGELSSLRGHVDRAVLLGNQEESFRSKLQQEEVEKLRREMEQLRKQLMTQEEDVYQQQADVRETRRQYEHSCKTWESLADSCSTHTADLARMLTQHQQARMDVRELRLTVSELKDSVRDLVLRDRLPSTSDVPQKSMAAVSVEMSPQRQMLSRSDSEDGFSPTPSLGEVSSDDLETSWLGEAAPKQRSHGEGARLSMPGSDISDAGSGLGSNHDDGGGEVEGVSDSSADLSLSDL
ncbi:uncharacterized protein LOC143523056 isoform X2 [Brachyhypopomus gauderio]